MYFFRAVFSEIGVELFNIHKRSSYSQALPNCINLIISFTHRTLRHKTTLHLLWLPLAVTLIYKLICIFTTHSDSDPLPRTTCDTAVTPGWPDTPLSWNYNRYWAVGSHGQEQRQDTFWTQEEAGTGEDHHRKQNCLGRLFRGMEHTSIWVHVADGSLLGGNIHTIRKPQTLKCMTLSSTVSRVYIFVINWATYNNQKHQEHEHQNQFSM